MIDKKAHIKFHEWAKYAEEDFIMAKLALQENGPPNQICFHSQQVAEKYLKGFLVFYREKFEKTHQIGYLLERCNKIDTSFEELKEEAFFLSRFYIETRYPGDIPEFSLEHAKKAFQSCKKIKEFILEKIN